MFLEAIFYVGFKRLPQALTLRLEFDPYPSIELLKRAHARKFLWLVAYRKCIIRCNSWSMIHNRDCSMHRWSQCNLESCFYQQAIHFLRSCSHNKSGASTKQARSLERLYEPKFLAASDKPLTHRDVAACLQIASSRHRQGYETSFCIATYRRTTKLVQLKPSSPILVS